MDAALDAIRVATSDGASSAERARGAALCRAIADMLDGNLNPPDGGAASPPAVAAARGLAKLEHLATVLADPAVRADVQASLAGIDIDALLDTALASLQGMIPGANGLPSPVGRPFRVPLIPLPTVPR